MIELSVDSPAVHHLRRDHNEVLLRACLRNDSGVVGLCKWVVRQKVLDNGIDQVGGNLIARERIADVGRAILANGKRIVDCQTVRGETEIPVFHGRCWNIEPRRWLASGLKKASKCEQKEGSVTAVV